MCPDRPLLPPSSPQLPQVPLSSPQLSPAPLSSPEFPPAPPSSLSSPSSPLLSPAPLSSPELPPVPLSSLLLSHISPELPPFPFSSPQLPPAPLSSPFSSYRQTTCACSFQTQVTCHGIPPLCLIYLHITYHFLSLYRYTTFLSLDWVPHDPLVLRRQRPLPDPCSSPAAMSKEAAGLSTQILSSGHSHQVL